MAVSDSSNPPVTSEPTREDLEQPRPAPANADEALRRDLFLWPGTAANAALAELALLEREGRTRLVARAISGLEASVMYRQLDDESYRTQDLVLSRFISANFPGVLRDARLFAAGQLAERRRRKRRRT